MASLKVYTNNLLTIEVIEDSKSIQAIWKGKSVDREPSKFITPLLVRLNKRCSDHGKRLILDFRTISFMNSSTITPIIRILERAKRGSTQIAIQYDGTLKWQDLIFSALTIFETKDNRVELQG
ncbi:hypothetical protein ACFL45_07260 [Candidatus Neomarinimicrobiota bacterium]|jgi:hypothetical protein